MRGGKIVGIKDYCALVQFSVKSLLILSLCAGAGTSSSFAADPVAEDDHCVRKAPPEQSIVVSSKTIAGATPLVIVTDKEDAASKLQPIAKVSEYVPDLADPVESKPLVPTLAEPLEPVEPVQVAAVSKKVSIPSKASGAKQQPEKSYTFIEPEAISFHGITPGISKRINVLRTWGDPRSDDTQAETLLYRFDDLPSVHVSFTRNQVSKISVKLEKPLAIATLLRKLKLETVRPASVRDADGKTTGQLFPERGITLQFDQDPSIAIIGDSEELVVPTAEPHVSNIIIRPIMASPFLLRANETTTTNLASTIVDLETALRFDRSQVEARDHLSEIYLLTGKAVTAERYSAEAVEFKPGEPRYRLQLAKCLRHLARYDRAVEETRQVLETPDIAPILRAQALNEMALLAALGSHEVAQRAMPLHAKAIEIADGLSLSGDPQVSQQAMELLVEAHLAIAVEISQGEWEGKDKSVPQWIERASALAEAAIDEDQANLPLRLKVAVSALAAAGNMEQPIDPSLWIEEAEETTATIKQRISDPTTLGQHDWLLGLAYFHGSQIEHRRSEPETAMHLSGRADQQLSELAKDRDELPDTSYLMGRLYFQIGAIHAVHYNKHADACEWYDQAIDRLLNPVPVTTMANPQQHGDALVSMGVSYWNQQNRDRAIAVTESGVQLIEQAVTSGLLDAKSLLVPYNNLAAMYEAQGETEPAARYENLARKITGNKVSQKPKRARQKQRR